MADKIAQCPASANTTVAARDRSIAGECEHHQRAAGTFNGFHPVCLFLSLFRSNALNLSPPLVYTPIPLPSTLSPCILRSIADHSLVILPSYS